MFGGVKDFDTYYLFFGAEVNSHILAQPDSGYLSWPLFERDVKGIHLWVIAYLHSVPLGYMGSDLPNLE